MSFVSGRIFEAPIPSSSLSRWKISSSSVHRVSYYRYAPIHPAPDSRAPVWRSLPARTSTTGFFKNSTLKNVRALTKEFFSNFSHFFANLIGIPKSDSSREVLSCLDLIILGCSSLRSLLPDSRYRAGCRRSLRKCSVLYGL